MNSTEKEALLKMWEANDEESMYLLNRDKLIRNFVSMQEAFRRYYPNTYIAYSYKTNYTTAICKTIDNLGGYAEVVSEYEYYHAYNRVGVRGSRIIYNGVADDNYHKLLAIGVGSIVNVDSLEQLKDIIDMKAQRGNQPWELVVGLRIALDKNGGADTRFGMTPDEVDRAIQYVKSYGGTIAGIHCHVGGSRSIESWATRTGMMIEIAKYIEDKTGKPLEYVDLGGHMFGNMDPALRLQFEDPVTDFKDYARVVAVMFNQGFGLNGPKLILEPGTALIADAVSILTKVIDVKRRGQKDIVTLDVSSRDCGMIADAKNLTIKNVSREELPGDQEYAVYGNTCMEFDFINRSYKGQLRKDDLVQILNTGAYSNVLKPPFITPGIAMWMVDDNYRPLELVKEKRNVRDFACNYVSETYISGTCGNV